MTFRGARVIPRAGLLVLLLIPQALLSQTFVPTGTIITTNTTWDLAGSPFVIDDCGVTVASGATLTIAPGVVVKPQRAGPCIFSVGGLAVSGGLVANGTSAQPIVFTSFLDDAFGGDTNGDGNAATPAPGNWGSIYFASGATGLINHAVVRYGGANSWMIYIASGNASVSLTNSTISNTVNPFGISSIIVISFSSAVTAPTISNNIFTQNSAGISATVGAAPTITGNTIFGSSIGVIINGGAVPHINFNNIQGNSTWGVWNADCPNDGTCSLTPDVDATNNFWGAATGPSGAGPGTGDKVSFHVNFGPFASQAITITPLPPVIMSISHTLGTQGERITNFAVNGNNFQPTSVLSFGGTGITVNSYSLRMTKLIVASITIADSAIPGPRDVIVSNGSEQSPLAGPFTVLQTPSGQLTLTPQNVLLTPKIQNPVLTPDCPRVKGSTGKVEFTASLRTVDGFPLPRVLINFEVVGANPTKKSAPTNSAGLAIFSYGGTSSGKDTVTATATINNMQIVSNTAFAEWGVVTITFKLPLPAFATNRWQVTTQVGDPTDAAHQCNGYYSVDFVDGLAAGSEPPVLAASDGIVESAGGTGEHIPSDQCQPPFPQGSLGTFVTLKHENGFETKYGHLKAGKTLEVRKNGTAKEGEVFDVMDDTGCSSGVHLHFQVVYGGTSFKNDSLRIFIERTRIEDYCKTDNLGNACKYPSTNNGRPFGNIDLPFKHDIVRGTVNVSGWALDDGSISFIKFLINGTTVAIGNYGVARPDVCTFAPTGAGLPPYTWPGFTTCPNIEFNGSFDSTMIPDGLHALDVAATDNRGAERIIDRHMIRVNNR